MWTFWTRVEVFCVKSKRFSKICLIWQIHFGRTRMKELWYITEAVTRAEVENALLPIILLLPFWLSHAVLHFRLQTLLDQLHCDHTLQLNQLLPAFRPAHHKKQLPYVFLNHIKAVMHSIPRPIYPLIMPSVDL